MRLFFILLFLTGLAPVAMAQQEKQYTFTHFTTADGLPSNLINSMVQDEEGYMWFATVNGITRFDGYRFQNFDAPHNNPGFKYGNVALLFYDHNHDIWFLTADFRSGVINARNFTMKEVNAEVMKKNAYQGAHFSEMHDGTLIVQEFRGNTYRYNRAQNRFVIDSTLLPFPKGWAISDITWDSSVKKYWISADKGLALYNPATKAMSYPGHNIEREPAIDVLQNERDLAHFFLDKDHNLNFETWRPDESHPYIQHYNRSTHIHIKFNLSDKLHIGYHEIGGQIQQRNGQVWLYGATFFAQWMADRNQLTPVLNAYRNEQSLKFDNIRYGFEDGELNIWIATDNGLFLFNPGAQLFNNYTFFDPKKKAFTEYPATSVLQLPDSTILVGCWGAGLFRFDKDFNPLPAPQHLQKTLSQNPSIWAIHRHSRSGNIWFGLQGGALVVYNPKKDKAQYYIAPAFENRTIRQITEDSLGNLWFGTQGGALVKWNYKQAGDDITTGYSVMRLAPARILKLMTDSAGFLWAAAYAHGIYKVDPVGQTVVKHFLKNGPPGEMLTDDLITDLLQYNKNTLIAVGKSLNIIDLRTYRVTHLTTAEGLPSNTGATVTSDQNGMVWLGMESGLCRINLKRNLFNLYNRSSGIEYDNFNPASAFRIADGRIVFATDHNVLVFDPASFTNSTFVPPDPEISAITLSDIPISVDSIFNVGNMELDYDNSSIAFQFSILSFLKQKQPAYVYMMEGFDKDWSPMRSTNTAVYSYLPPGDYVFKVIAINQDGMLRGKATELKIYVHSPFWRTWWFYGLLTLAGVTLLYIIDKERRKKAEALLAVRTQIAGDLHEEINLTLNDINLLSEIAKIKADKDIDRSKDYIDQISAKSRTMIESMDDMLWSIQPENDSMERMLLRLHEFTDGLKRTTDVTVELSVDKEVARLKPDMKTRHEFLLFFKDALLYVIQQSVCSPVYISMEFQKGKLALKLLAQCNQTDDGATQISQLEQGMHRRAQALNGLLDVMSDRKSISIILQVPV